MSSYGIDFGTTNSVVASYNRDNRILTVLDKEKRPYPSVVWWCEGSKVIVGREAKDRINSFIDVPGNCFVRSIKRKLGTGQVVPVLGETKHPYEIASEIFKHLNDQTKTQLLSKSGIEQAVITVPVHFDGHQRADLRKGADLAGIHVQTFIHEPFAAVVGYLLGKGDKSNLSRYHGQNIMVFDWGGGTLDITVVRIEKDRLMEVSTSGIADIAGDHFDDVLAKMAINRFMERYRIGPGSFEVTPANKDKLSAEAERRKIELSARSKTEDVVTTVSISNFASVSGRILTLQEPITRGEFSQAILEDVNRALGEVNRALNIAGIGDEHIGLVLLTGGTCRIPLVRALMIQRFGARVVEVENSDTIIAEGAAIVAGNNWRPFLSKPVMIEISDRSYYSVFDVGTAMIPNALKKEVRMFCTDNREGEARLIVGTGNPRDEQGSLILKIPLKSNVPSKYLEDVTTRFAIDENLVMHVQGYASIRQEVVTGSVYDLCFGLQII